MIPVLWTELFNAENGCSPESVQQVERHLGLSLPWVLKHFYTHYDKHPLNQAHNRLILPDKLEVDENGFMIIYEENQGVVLWAISSADFSEANPVVYESYDNGTNWVLHEDKELLSNFLTDITLFQAVMGGYPFCAGHFGVEASIEETIKQQYEPLATDVVKRGMRYYGNPRQLIAIMEGEDSNDLWIACHQKTPFLNLLRKFKIGWDYNSLDD